MRGELEVGVGVAGDVIRERTFNILIKLHTTHMILMNKSSNNGRRAVRRAARGAGGPRQPK